MPQANHEIPRILKEEKKNGQDLYLHQRNVSQFRLAELFYLAGKSIDSIPHLSRFALNEGARKLRVLSRIALTGHTVL